MREVNIRTLDLNLLVALNALLEERHVTRASERVNLSQPAMSRALSRLRIMFQDPLLVKGAAGMALTARAQALQAPLQHLLREITDLITPPAVEPAEIQGEIVIATRDNELITFLPQVIHQITMEAPQLKLRIISLVGDDLSVLEEQKADFVLSGTESKSATLHRSMIYEERFVCLISSKHKILGQKVSLEDYLAMKHCLVTITGFGTSVIDDCLAKKGLNRTIAVRVPHFLASAFIVAASELIVTLPHRVGQLFAHHENITLLELPIDLPHWPIYLYWHTRNQHNPRHQWVKEIIKNVEKGVSSD